MLESDVLRWLESITISDVPALQKRIERTYQHPYGFVVQRLLIEEVHPWTIRLHHWPAPEECYRLMRFNAVEGQLIHAHGWDLLSRVLRGALEERVFHVIDDSSGTFTAYATPGNNPGSASILRKLPKRLSVSDVEYRTRTDVDMSYKIDAGMHHATLPATDSVSLVATLQFQGQVSEVLASQDAGETISNRSPQLLEVPEQDRSDSHWASCFVFLLRDEQVFLVRTSARPSQWQPIGGERDPEDASPMATVLREVLEETALSLQPTDLHWLGARPADAGSGHVCFWSARVPSYLSGLQLDEEIAEGAFWNIADAVGLEMFDGTRWGLGEIGREAGGIAGSRGGIT